MNEPKQMESDINPIWEQFERNKDQWRALFEAERQIGRCEMLCDIVERERTKVIDSNILIQREKWEHEPVPF